VLITQKHWLRKGSPRVLCSDITLKGVGRKIISTRSVEPNIELGRKRNQPCQKSRWEGEEIIMKRKKKEM
jgi:hypothetical protein